VKVNYTKEKKNYSSTSYTKKGFFRTNQFLDFSEEKLKVPSTALIVNFSPMLGKGGAEGGLINVDLRILMALSNLRKHGGAKWGVCAPLISITS